MVIIYESLQNVKLNYLGVMLNNGNIFDMDFTSWLKLELDKRNWNYAELARHSHMTEPAISLLMSGKRKPGVDMCKSLAKALNLPIRVIYERAGLMPIDVDNTPELDELKHWFNQMTGEEQEEFLASGRLKVELRIKRQRESPTPGN